MCVSVIKLSPHLEVACWCQRTKTSLNRLVFFFSKARALEAESIEAKPAWKPMHLQLVFNPHPRGGIAFGFHPDGMKEKTDSIGQAGQGFPRYHLPELRGRRRLTQIMKRKAVVISINLRSSCQTQAKSVFFALWWTLGVSRLKLLPCIARVK